MKIELEGSLIKFTPENERESDELNQLWSIIINCVNENKKLVPVGEYMNTEIVSVGPDSDLSEMQEKIIGNKQTPALAPTCR